MGINVYRANNQANRIRDNASTLRDVRNRLSNIKESLNGQWNAEEMIFLNIDFDKICNDIAVLSSRLDSLVYDIVATANEIRREEEAAAAAAAAAKAKAKAKAK